jgi:predicted amidohydrolase YtcJ
MVVRIGLRQHRAMRRPRRVVWTERLAVLAAGGALAAIVSSCTEVPPPMGNDTGPRRRTDAGPDPDGYVLRDQAGRPTGVLLESAAWRAWAAAPEPSPAEWRGLIADAAAHLAALGFDRCHDMLSPPWLAPMLLELEAAGQLPLDVTLFAPLADAATTPRPAGDRVRLGGLKLFADGTLNSRTAWMLAPYADGLPGMPTGKPLADASAIAAALRTARDAGLTLAVHAIGDAAVRAGLDAAARARLLTTLRDARTTGLATLWISHDLEAVGQLATRTASLSGSAA